MSPCKIILNRVKITIYLQFISNCSIFILHFNIWKIYNVLTEIYSHSFHLVISLCMKHFRLSCIDVLPSNKLGYYISCIHAQHFLPDWIKKMSLLLLHVSVFFRPLSKFLCTCFNLKFVWIVCQKVHFIVSC